MCFSEGPQIWLAGSLELKKNGGKQSLLTVTPNSFLFSSLILFSDSFFFSRHRPEKNIINFHLKPSKQLRSMLTSISANLGITHSSSHEDFESLFLSIFWEQQLCSFPIMKFVWAILPKSFTSRQLAKHGRNGWSC